VATSSIERPFDNYRTAITEAEHFFGRGELLDEVRSSPFQLRIILGGRRLGKTSFLRAVEWSLLDSGSRAFPVYIDLQGEQPESLDNFRYIVIARLREAIDRWKQVPLAAAREMYRRFLRQITATEVTLGWIKFKLGNKDYDRKLINDDFKHLLLDAMEELRDWDRQKFDGVCLILDEADFIARQDWADDAWGYLRSLKDSDTAIRSRLGLLLSGYRDLKEYRQGKGSPFPNIGERYWLGAFTDAEMRQLVEHRIRLEQASLADDELIALQEWAGTHPYLLQQLLNGFFDNYREPTPRPLEKLLAELMHRRADDFSRWWQAGQEADGLEGAEQTIYRELIVRRECTAETLATSAGLPVGRVANSLELLAGTGIIRQLDEERFIIGAKLFEQWVVQQ
jgi:hypothetical protein